MTAGWGLTLLKIRTASLTTSPRHVGTCGHLRPPDQNVDHGSFSTLLAVCCTWSRARLCCGYKANLLIINAHKSCDMIILFSSSSRLCKTRETVDIFVGRRSKRQRDKEERTGKRGRSRAHQRLIQQPSEASALQQPQASDFVQDIAPWSNKSPLKSLPSRGQVVDLCRAKWCLSSWSLLHVSVSVSGLYLVGEQVNLLSLP